MDKKKLITSISVTVAGLITMTAAGLRPDAAVNSAVSAARNTAYFAAGITIPQVSAVKLPELAAELITREQSGESPVPSGEAPVPSGEAPVLSGEAPGLSGEAPALTGEARIQSAEAQGQAGQDPAPSDQADAEKTGARVISRNITEFHDDYDLTSSNRSGTIVREHFSGYQGDDYIQLPDGGLVWNCTSDSAESILTAAGTSPGITIERSTPEPQVLIIHTHTTESYEPWQRDYYDSALPSRTRDPSRNMIRVGEAMAEVLAENGISVLHDGTIHDYPSYTGSYDRSEATIRAALEEFPSIKVILDLHRDAISGGGVRTAPVAEINGKSAAQFMIITGCDDGRFGNMPDYDKNLSLACAIQSAAEGLFPGLSRPVLFDYRNYNQHISTGSLLIEIGGHANSLDEAVYTGQLLGEAVSAALR